MAEIKDIVECARTYLTSGWVVGSGRGGSRVRPEVIFDHSTRVLELAKRLNRDSAMAEAKIDELILTASALFHDAGWIELVKAGTLTPGEIYSRPADADVLGRGAQSACDQLGKLLSARQLEKVTMVIAGLKQSEPDQPETILIADAENLDDFGLSGIFQQVRAAQSCGKSNRQILESWARQQEYHYWDARIKSALHLETSRKIAGQRLGTMGEVFDLLRRELDLDDMESLLPELENVSL
jgi:hypothetical protein